CQQNSGYPTF
nr:immunoglobulin light chain junction region [Macaca mulatta]